MNEVEWVLVREIDGEPRNGREGYTLGRLYFDSEGEQVCFTVEDQDRRLEAGGVKVHGKTTIPLGRYRLSLYDSPKHGPVPLYHDVPGFSYCEIHKANTAKDLLGCTGVGALRTLDGVLDCAGVLAVIVAQLRKELAAGREVFVKVTRA